MRQRALRLVLASSALALLGGLAVPAAAAPPDPWAIETDHKSDALLIKQRFAKLKKRPFDKKQWRALERSLGKSRLIEKIEHAAAAAPKNRNLAVLAGRAAMAKGDHRSAAQIFAKLDTGNTKQSNRIFELRVQALDEGKAWQAAIEALEIRAGSRGDGTDSRKLLERAYRIADKADLDTEALRLARELSRRSPKDPDATLRVARAAQEAGDPRAADEAYAHAIENARGDRRLDLEAQRARARINGGDPDGGAELLWDLLHKPDRGRSYVREDWWRALEVAHRKSASSDELASRLERWLTEPAHQREVAGWQTLARARAAAGQDPVSAWRRALEINPRSPETRTALIAALEAQGDSQGALNEYRSLAGRSQPEVQLGLEMASRLLTNGERKTALEIAAQIRDKAGRSSTSLLLLLDFYNTHDEPQLALDVARRLAAAKKRDPEARVALGEQLYEMGRRDEALAEWGKLPKLTRPSHKGWARHAEILSAHADTDRRLRNRALTSLEKALAASPRNPNYLRLRAVLEEDRRTYDRAYESWQLTRQYAKGPEHQLVREEARTRIVELLAGVSLPRKADKRARAVEQARKDLASGPSPEARESGLFLATLYAREDKHRAAADVRKKLVQLFPGDGELMMDLAVAQRRAGDGAAAMKTLDAVLEVDPSRRVDALSMLSELAYERGELAQAEDAAARAAAAGSGGSRALLKLGELYERHGDVKKAKEAYQSVLDKSPNDPHAHLKLAELQLTAGDLDGAAASFRKLLEAGGPADLMREAGQRALDLAEITDTLDELLALAVLRTKRDPDLDEARDFLLATLDRTSHDQIEHWLRSGTDARAPNRVNALRRPLVSALSRGPIHVRLRAAQHLGALALPDTAVPLTRMGANLAAPGDATNALRNAYSQARVAAIEAAARLDDEASIPLLVAIVEQDGGRRHDRTTRHAALWALANSRHEAALDPLRRQLETRGGDELSVSISCIGIAGNSGGEQRVQDMVRAHRIASSTSKSTVRHACAYAAAALTPDHRAIRLHDQLRSRDPMLAAIAAWRLGGVDPAKVQPETVQSLFEVYFGPAGRPRDAAVSALARLLGARVEDGRRLPRPNEGRWSSSIERWLGEQVAFEFEPVPAAALAPHMGAFEQAYDAARDGTRAEARAAEAARRSCGNSGGTDTPVGSAAGLCLEPLIAETVAIPATTARGSSGSPNPSRED